MTLPASTRTRTRTRADVGHTTVAAPLDTLHALLDASLARPPEYGPGLSSHLPMALEALHALGAGPVRLQAFAAAYGRRFDGPAPTATRAATEATEAIGTTDPPVLGRVDDFPRWRHHFAGRIAAHGPHATVRTALRDLLPGVAAAAFHGLIRTAHAVHAGHDAELAAALAYWASRWRPTPVAADGPTLPLATWLGRLRDLARTPDGRGPGPRSLISARMAHWAGDPRVQATGGRLSPGDLPALARLAAGWYAATADFTVLHVVTASAALRRLSAWSDASALAVVPPAIATALLASGTLTGGDAPPSTDAPRAAEPPDWAALSAGAVAQDDDHVVKLVLACRELDAADPDPAWRRAAARALGLA